LAKNDLSLWQGRNREGESLLGSTQGCRTNKLVAVFSKPRPRCAIGLLKRLVTPVAQKDADLIHAEAVEVVYPAILADTPATGASGNVASTH
jgi:hypothetical protein